MKGFSLQNLRIAKIKTSSTSVLFVLYVSFLFV